MGRATLTVAAVLGALAFGLVAGLMIGGSDGEQLVAAASEGTSEHGSTETAEDDAPRQTQRSPEEARELHGERTRDEIQAQVDAYGENGWDIQRGCALLERFGHVHDDLVTAFADELDVTVDELLDAARSVAAERLDEAVAAGHLSEDRAERLLSAIDDPSVLCTR